MGICGSTATAGLNTKSYAPPKAGPHPRPAKAASKRPKSMSTEDDFELLERVGKGAYGEVFRAKDKRTQEIVAVKRIARSDIDRFVVEEVQNLSKCRHHQIIQFKEAYINDHHLAIVMEYANGGDLHAYVQKKGRLSEKEARWLYQQLITAVDYCHSQSIVNRDLKLENTLLVSTSRMPLIKICDFGVSKSSPMSAMYTKGIGTPGYTAPEVLLGGGGSYNGRLADVFSSGVILYIMIFGEHPFVDVTEVSKGSFQNTHSRIARCQYSFPAQVQASQDVKDLLKRIFVPEAKQRISIDEIFQHPWFVKDIPPAVLDRSYLKQGRSDQNAHKLSEIIRDANAMG